MNTQGIMNEMQIMGLRKPMELMEGMWKRKRITVVSVYRN